MLREIDESTNISFPIPNIISGLIDTNSKQDKSITDKGSDELGSVIASTNLTSKSVRNLTPELSNPPDTPCSYSTTFLSFLRGINLAKINFVKCPDTGFLSTEDDSEGCNVIYARDNDGARLIQEDGDKPKFRFFEDPNSFYSYLGEIQDSMNEGFGISELSKGDIYVGEWHKDLFHGKGIRYFPNKKFVVGVFKDGELFEGMEFNFDEQGNYKYPYQRIVYSDGSTFIGECKNGHPSGFGVKAFTSGAVCIGEFKDGDFYRGIWFKNSFKLMGQWHQNKFKLGAAQGEDCFYLGEWQDGPHGRGIIEIKQNQVRFGNFNKCLFEAGVAFKNGLNITRTNKFTTLSNGESYYGDWYNGKPHGQGVLKKRHSTLSGEFKEGKLDGKGEWTDHCGKFYKGMWKSGKREGEGITNYSPGLPFFADSLGFCRSYIGSFVDDRCHGPGTVTLSNGGTIEGVWQEGDLKGVITKKIPNGIVITGEVDCVRGWPLLRNAKCIVNGKSYDIGTVGLEVSDASFCEEVESDIGEKITDFDLFLKEKNLLKNDLQPPNKINKTPSAIEIAERESIPLRKFEEKILENFSELPIAGDGDCCIRSIMRAFNPHLASNADVHSIRKQFIDFIKANADVLLPNEEYTFRQKVDIDKYVGGCSTNGIPVNSFNEYLEVAGRRGVFLGNLELNALSHMFKCPIWVYRAGSIVYNQNKIEPLPLNKFGETYKDEKSPIHLVFRVDHYQTLVPKISDTSRVQESFSPTENSQTRGASKPNLPTETSLNALNSEVFCHGVSVEEDRLIYHMSEGPPHIESYCSRDPLPAKVKKIGVWPKGFAWKYLHSVEENGKIEHFYEINLSNGSKYIGNVDSVNGQKSFGIGRLTYPDGSYYEGCWNEHRHYHNQGMKRFSNGSIFIGNWIVGIPQEGVAAFPNGNVFIRGKRKFLESISDGIFIKGDQIREGKWENFTPYYTQTKQFPELPEKEEEITAQDIINGEYSLSENDLKLALEVFNKFRNSSSPIYSTQNRNAIRKNTFHYLSKLEDKQMLSKLFLESYVASDIAGKEINSTMPYQMLLTLTNFAIEFQKDENQRLNLAKALQGLLVKYCNASNQDERDLGLDQFWSCLLFPSGYANASSNIPTNNNNSLGEYYENFNLPPEEEKGRKVNANDAQKDLTLVHNNQLSMALNVPETSNTCLAESIFDGVSSVGQIVLDIVSLFTPLPFGLQILNASLSTVSSAKKLAHMAIDGIPEDDVWQGLEASNEMINIMSKVTSLYRPIPSELMKITTQLNTAFTAKRLYNTMKRGESGGPRLSGPEWYKAYEFTSNLVPGVILPLAKSDSGWQKFLNMTNASLSIDDLRSRIAKS